MYFLINGKTMIDIYLEDDMDMPCLCDCGQWFDLEDGSSKRNSDKVICPNCGAKDEKIKELEDEIFSLELQGNKKREIKKLRKEIEKLK